MRTEAKRQGRSGKSARPARVFLSAGELSGTRRGWLDVLQRSTSRSEQSREQKNGSSSITEYLEALSHEWANASTREQAF